MLSNVTHLTETRIAEYQACQHQRLLDRAHDLQLQADPDYISAGGMVVWSPLTRGRCEVVEPGRCSCREWRVWRRCPHMALYRELFGRSQ